MAQKKKNDNTDRKVDVKALRAQSTDSLGDFELLQVFVHDSREDAFEVLVNRHRRVIFNFIMKMVRKVEVADDLFQETFLRVLKNADSYTPRAKFTTWALQIARNLTLDHYKRERLRQHPSIDTPIGSEGNSTIASLIESGSPESTDILMKGELEEYLRDEIAHLPDNQREALVLRIYEELPYAEIGEVMGHPEGTVKYWVHEAIAALGEKIKRKGLR
ncbi:MAG: RNA polymerase sigma factor [Planctomycetota bacterium]